MHITSMMWLLMLFVQFFHQGIYSLQSQLECAVHYCMMTTYYLMVDQYYFSPMPSTKLNNLSAHINTYTDTDQCTVFLLGMHG